MTRLTFIQEQFDWVDQWTVRQLETLDEIYWQILPALSTSINWQVGHIIISKYFHAIHSIVDDENNLKRELQSELPLDEFLKYYFAGSDPTADWVNRPGKEELLIYLNMIDQQAKHILDSLNEDMLAEKTFVANPIAQTKYDALTFCFKHQMWHNGQIAMLSRTMRSEG